MKNKTEKQVDGFVIESATELVKKQEKHTNGLRGRHAKFPLMKIPLNHGIFLKGTVISKVSPLIHYFNTKQHRNLHCRTVKRKEGEGVFVYRTRTTTHQKQLAQAGAN